MSNYRNILEAYLRNLDVRADSVADVGGAALPVRDRVRTWDVKDYQIIDNQTEKGIEGVDADWDMNKQIPIADIPTFDVVFCLEVMEYVYNPIQALTNLRHLSKPGGLLYITFPFLYPTHEPRKADMLRYTAEGAGRLLGEAGFRVLDMQPRLMTDEGFAAYKQFLKHEGMHASRHTRHDILGWIIKATI